MKVAPALLALQRWPLVVAVVGAFLVAVGLSPRRAEAQTDYFRVSPGPLGASHAAYDHSAGCSNCHVSAQGVVNTKCLGCHSGIDHRGGLHASFGSKPCISCHVEHKGRDRSLVNWGTIGGRDAFDHARTGFPLGADHAQVACTKCHVRRSKSGGTAYLGLSRDCQSCHRGAHGFTDRKLAENCATCHKPGQGLRGRRLGAWSGPHQRASGVSLEGRHRELPCTDCHAGGVMAGRSPPRGCVDCHPPPHPVIPATRDCASCHPQQGSFDAAKVDHGRYGFELTGRHAKVDCGACHRGAQSQRPGRGKTRDCVDCHRANHPVTAATARCASCHSPARSFAGAHIDHGQFGLPLRGKHATLPCQRCHQPPQKRLGYSEGDCTSCHTHRGAHGGQFADKPCASCHVEGGKRDRPFDHDVDSRFPLRGLHADPKVSQDCARCHPKGIYRTGKVACRDCHQDAHQGKFGGDCARCHSPMVPFAQARAADVDHSAFPLEGRHRTVACRECHERRRYDPQNPRCVDCHAQDDVHRGRLGKDCGQCHRPEPGAPKFQHDTMTGFPLDGAHRRVSCARCHQGRSGAARPRTLAEWRATPTPALDLGFPVAGKRCQSCHADPHRGYAEGDCARCHTATRFAALTGPRARAILPGSHRGAWWRRHATVPANQGELGGESNNCAVCHGAPACKNCHLTHAPRSHGGLWRLRTHGSAASFDVASCRTCHQTASCTACHRQTRPLNHRGSWSTLHGYAAGGFGPSNCSVCHSRADCLRCHGGG